MSFDLAEKELGRALNRAHLHIVPTLNEIAAPMVEELQRLSWLAADAYLRWHVRPGSEPFHADFYRDVVRGGADPKAWGVRNVLVAVDERRKGQALAMTADGARATLAGVEGERWMRISVSNARDANRSSASSGPGAPGVLVRDAPYWWAPPEGAMDYIVFSASMSNVIPVEMDIILEHEFVVAFRRWIARRVSWWARSKFTTTELSSATPERVAAAIGVGWHQVSMDGTVALAALIREAALPFHPDKHVYGYIGPDEWFTG